MLSLLTATTLGGFAAAGGTPTAADTGPNGSWTQLDNPNFPTYLDCRDTAHGNGPCVMWPRDLSGKNWSQANNTYTWSDTYGRNVDWHDEIRQAVADLNAHPYRSPSFSNEVNPCDLCVIVDTTTNPEGGTCGQSFDHEDPSAPNAIYKDDVTIFANNNWIITQSDINQIGPGQVYCDLRNAVRHEFVHALGEGHSTVAADLMDPQGGTADREFYDTDAKDGLNTMYGPLPGSSGGGGGTGEVGCVSTANTAVLSLLPIGGC